MTSLILLIKKDYPAKDDLLLQVRHYSNLSPVVPFLCRRPLGSPIRQGKTGDHAQTYFPTGLPCNQLLPGLRICAPSGCSVYQEML